jgi:hypothetical protein
MRLEGKAVEGLDRIQRMIEEKKHLVMYDEEGFIRFLDELITELVKIVKGTYHHE